MRRSARRGAGAIAGLLLTAGVAGAAGAATPHKGGQPAGVLDDPCTLLAAARVEKVFGGPVADPVLDEAYVSCRFDVGDDPTQEPGGVVTVVQLFPRFGHALDTAKAAFVDQHAIDVLSDYELADVEDLGRDAYMNLTSGTLVVLANKEFQFSVSWAPGSQQRELTKKQQKQLVKLAKQIVKRAPDDLDDSTTTTTS